MRAAGIHAIPVLVFEVDGVAKGDWLENRECKGREVFIGSGHKADFRSILEQLHADCVQEESAGGDLFTSLQLPEMKVKTYSKF